MINIGEVIETNDMVEKENLTCVHHTRYQPARLYRLRP